MQALEAIKVVEFAWFGVGPMIAECLGFHGATVVKIESNSHPDPYRLDEPRAGRIGWNRSGAFALYNANTYGATLELSHPEGKEIAIELLKQADVVVQGFSPGVMKQFDLDYESVKEFNPEVIYLNTAAQGQSGPHCNISALGSHMTALCGFAHITGWPDKEIPAYPNGALPDFLSVPLALAAVLAALDYRRRTGKGQNIDHSQFEASLQFLAPAILDYEVNGRIAQRIGNRCPYAAPHGVFPCKGEDKWVAIAVFSDEEWQSLSQAMGTPQWTCPWCSQRAADGSIEDP